MPSFPSRYDATPPVPTGVPEEALVHAPKAVSITPLLVGLVIMGLGLMFTAAGINTPFIVPANAPGSEVSEGDEAPSIALPDDLEGTIDLYVREGDSRSYGLVQDELEATRGVIDEPEVSGPVFVVADSRGEPAEAVGTPRFSKYEGRDDEYYQKVMSVDLRADEKYELTVNHGWVGQVAFVTADDPPTEPNWRSIVQGLGVLALGAVITVVSGIRRLRWRARIRQYRAEIATGS